MAFAKPEPAGIGWPAAPVRPARKPNPDVDDAWAVLADVPDPEIPSLGLVDLGVIRDVAVDAGGRVKVRMSPTYTACPATDMMRLMIVDRLIEAGFAGAEVEMVLSPPWSTDRITAAGRQKLKAAGIAPPVGRSTDKRHLIGTAPDVHCPHCGTADAEMLSAFGSTACKALYRCRSCREPFDYFKCI